MNGKFLKFDMNIDINAVNENCIIFKFNDTFILRTANSKYSLSLPDMLKLEMDYNLKVIDVDSGANEIKNKLNKNYFSANNELFAHVDSTNTWTFYNFGWDGHQYGFWDFSMTCSEKQLESLENYYGYNINKKTKPQKSDFPMRNYKK